MEIVKKKRNTFIVLSFILFFAFIPFEEYLVLPGIGSISRMGGILFTFIGIINILIKQKRIIPIKLPHVWVYGVFLLSICWSLNKDYSYSYFFTYLQYIVICYIMVQVLSNKTIIKSLGYFAVACIIITAMLIKGVDNGNFENRSTLLNLDPNELALLLNLGLATIIYLMKKQFILGLFPKMQQLLIFGISIVFLVAILKTGSRTGFVCFFLNLLYLLLATGYKGKKILFGVFSIFLLGIIVSPYLSRFVDISTINRVLETREQVQEGNLTGRGNIWINAISMFLKEPILGYGVGNSEYFLASYFQSGPIKSTHNIFLQVLLEVGIFGFCFFLYSLLSYYMTVLKIQNNTDKFYWIFIFILLIVGGLTLAIFKKKYYLIFFTLGFIFKRNEEKENSRNFL